MDEHDKQHKAIAEALKAMEGTLKALNELRLGMEKWLEVGVPAQGKFMQSQIDWNKILEGKVIELGKVVVSLAERVEALEKVEGRGSNL